MGVHANHAGRPNTATWHQIPAHGWNTAGAPLCKFPSCLLHVTLEMEQDDDEKLSVFSFFYRDILISWALSAFFRGDQ